MQLSLFAPPSPSSVQVRVLGSSSAGNCTVVWDGAHAVMIDCGFPARYIQEHLRPLGLSLETLSGLLITHAHSDHVHDSVLSALARSGVPVHCPESIRRPLLHRYGGFERVQRMKLLRSIGSEGTETAGFTVGAFRVPHDSPGGCYGFTLTRATPEGRIKIAVSTDIGYAEEGMLEHLADSDIIVVESNHDPDMLENSGRPAWLKRRIREIGHLSNGQCADLLTEVLRGSSRLPGAVVLAHISQECNTNPLAVHSARQALDAHGFLQVSVVQTFMMEPNEIVSVVGT